MKRLAVVVGGFALLFGAGCNKNDVIGTSGSLVADPSSLDYGRVREQDDLSQVVVLKNEGGASVRVTGLAIDPPNAPFHINATIPSDASPWVIDPGNFQPVDLHFVPEVSGDAGASLIVTSNDPHNPVITVPLAGKGFHTQTDTYSQGASIGGKADILFMVDNSGSMSDKQANLGNSFSTFINWLISKNVDYHIAINTTDMDNPAEQGRFQGTPKIIDNTTADVVNTFKTNVNVGDSGSGTEQGFASVAAGLGPALLASDNAGFLRTDAKLFVVYVSDEDDQSPGSINDQMNAIRAVKGGDASKVFFAAITGPQSGLFGCINGSVSAEVAPRYVGLINQTGGLWGSICDANFGTTLQNLAFQVTAAPGTFVLTAQPDVTTLKVFVNGVQAPSTQWNYDATTNSISFVAPYVPAGGVPVVIVYDVE